MEGFKFFNKGSITLTPIPDKGSTTAMNYSQIYMMNIDVKILNKILANPIQKLIKNIIHHDQASFIQ